MRKSLIVRIIYCCSDSTVGTEAHAKVGIYRPNGKCTTAHDPEELATQSVHGCAEIPYWVRRYWVVGDSCGPSSVFADRCVCCTTIGYIISVNHVIETISWTSDNNTAGEDGQFSPDCRRFCDILYSLVLGHVDFYVKAVVYILEIRKLKILFGVTFSLPVHE